MKLRSRSTVLVLSLTVVMASLVAGFAKLAIAKSTTKVNPSEMQAYEYQADENNRMVLTYSSQAQVIGLLIKRGDQLALYKQVNVAQPLGVLTLKLRKHRGESSLANEIKIDLRSLAVDSVALYFPDQGVVKLSSIKVKAGECPVTPSTISYAPNKQDPPPPGGCICMFPGHACSSVDPTGGPKEVDWWECFWCCVVTPCC